MTTASPSNARVTLNRQQLRCSGDETQSRLTSPSTPTAAEGLEHHHKRQSDTLHRLSSEAPSFASLSRDVALVVAADKNNKNNKDGAEAALYRECAQCD